ncbi:S8 family serine peptidase [Candidatus Oscillochloris fontis]|uniref:S8 family serine peptidase n=1 Tax=Candidatus Oscillochloris fontis TaxID=2496868 RepID=UPI00137590DD|nr:S8 family serine peptidase [Candidatus Oscillochloris fontis]
MHNTLRSMWGLLVVAGLILALQPHHAGASLVTTTQTTTPPSRYIVQLAGDPLVTVLAQASQLAGADPNAELDLTSSAAQRYQNQLAKQRAQVLATIAQRIGQEPPLAYSYDLVFHGVALELTAEQAAQIADLPGIVAVQPEAFYELTSDAGPTWIGADQVWNSGYMGEGVIIGMIDTGINTRHPSFAEVGGDGYRHLNPLGQGVYKGACDPTNLPSRANGNPSGYNPAIICNNKLIGAWTFPNTATAFNTSTGEPSPNDEHNHGSHTASTAAGNVLYNIVSGSVTYSRISGVAPHANIIAYDACGYTVNGVYYASCPSADLLAAVNQAVADQVDVISYSISGGADPWNDVVEQAFLNARTAGIVVSTSAGNSGPYVGTVAHVSPWVMSVAASTHDRANTTRTINPANGDLMAYFSSRGPALESYARVIKPDLAAPGSYIFAAYANTGGTSPNYGLMSGTSMSAPHVSGAAALLIGLHPDWSPSQVQSALMTTSYAPITKEDGITPTTPFDSGAGRVRLDRAARAGLLLDETSTNFRNTSPAIGGDARALNLPSMADPSCVYSCSWTRIVSNPLDVAVTWTATTQTSALSVEPASFTIPAHGTQSLTFTLNVAGKPFDTYVFDRATLSARDALAPDASFPVAAVPKTNNLASRLVLSATTSTSQHTRTISTLPYTALTTQITGLTQATRQTMTIANGVSDTSTLLVVPANTARLVAEIQGSTSQDVDLFLIRDANDNQILDSSEAWAWACYSATELVDEYCSIPNPTPGTYFVRVDNYLASPNQTNDPVTLLTAVVPNANPGNLTLDLPSSSPGGPIDLEFTLTTPTSVEGDFWYGHVKLADPNTSTTLVDVDVDFRHMQAGPAQLIVMDGNNQNAVINTAFTSKLSLIVVDSVGKRVPGAMVTFTSPPSGAGVTFPAGNTVTTDLDGWAELTVQANGTPGEFALLASVEGVSGPVSTHFSLRNLLQPYMIYLPSVYK